MMDPKINHEYSSTKIRMQPS
jgi:hypothetical protein